MRWAPVVAAAAMFALAPSAGAEQYVFRTLDSGAEPTATQTAFCNDAFGARSATVISRLNARLYSFSSNLASGRLADQTARELGPGFICGAPGTGGLDAAAFTELPGTGRQTLRGGCAPRPFGGQPGSLIVACALTAAPSPADSVLGGFATSNSVVNLGSASVPTGSVWTAYIARPSTAPAVPGVPAGAPPQTGDAPGIDFLVLRTTSTAVATSDPACATGATVRTAKVHAVQPDLGSGRIPEADGPVVGGLVLCLGAGGVSTARIRVPKAGGTLEINASGTCATSVVAGADDPLQHCNLTVLPADGIKDGLVTSNGLVAADAPAKTSGPGVWTVSMLGAPPDAPAPVASPAPAAPATVRLRAPRRARAGRVRLRWRTTPAGARFDLQAGRRRVLSNTARTTIRLRLRRGRVRVRVRVHPDGPWTTRVIRVRRRA